MTGALCLAIEPKGAAPNHFKRQFEPIIAMTVMNWRLAGFLLLSEGPDL